MSFLTDAAESFDTDSIPSGSIDEAGFRNASFECVSLFLRSALAMIARGQASEESQRFAIESFRIATACCPLAVATSLSNLLRTLDPTTRVSKVAVAIVCRAWCRAKGIEHIVGALVCDSGQASREAEASCVQYLCNFTDLVAAFAKGSEEDSHYEWLDDYAIGLATALVETWYKQFQSSADCGRGPELFARLCLRGDSPRLAAHLCRISLEASKSQEFVRFGSAVLCAVADENASAACSVVDSILQACGALFFTTKDGLACMNSEALHLLPALLGSVVRPGSPVHHSVTDRIWRRTLCGQLSAAVVFSLVDFLKLQPEWPEVRFRWCQVWAEESMLTSVDLSSQRALALRLVRTLACTADGEEREEIFGRCMGLLLQGVHIRLSAQVNESRWYGMAVAEAMGRSWPSAGGERHHLHFDGFDLSACGLGEFIHAGKGFECTGDLGKSEDVVAKLLHDLLQREEPESRIAAASDEQELGTESSPVVVEDVLVFDDREADSDDDNPLCGMPPLSPLHAVDENCSDLLLIQPPRYLRSAYEMLLGPPKEGSRNRTSPELPTAARARIRAALDELPKLIRADVPEIRSLAEPLCARLLHIADAAGIEEMTSQRKSALVSLLLAGGSRSLVARFLISQFGADDLMLMTRNLILTVLSEAAKELSNGGLSAAELNAIKREHPQLDPPLNEDGTKPKTRRFASATRIPVTHTNYFAAELRAWFFPLLARWRRPDAGNARSACSDPMVVGGVLQCFGVMLECAGKACPDRDAVAEKSLDLVEDYWSHSEPRVRRCCVFLLSRILLLGSDALVLDRPLLLDRIEVALLHESDETCRKMVAGIMAWVEQRSLG